MLTINKINFVNFKQNFQPQIFQTTNEISVKVYDEDEDAADYAMIRHAEGTKGAPVIGVSTDVVPRLFKTNVGDIFTTNAIKVAAPAVGGVLAPDAEGCLDTATEDATMKWQIVKVYTMPDGQKGVKIMRIA